ncbi:hypothetical protein ACI6Q2_16785 [Chitinophagaceae bacterium LWZ2-11]
MELDDLKIQFKEHEESDNKSLQELSALLSKDTNSIPNKIKRSLLFEITGNAFFIICFVILAVYTDYWSLRIYFSVASVLCFIFLGFLSFLLYKTNRLTSNALPVKNNLEQLYAILKEYTKRNVQFSLALAPICMLFCFWLGYNEPVRSKFALGNFFFFHAQTTQEIILLLTAYLLVFLIIVYYISQWYLKRLYGNYLNELKLWIDELQEDE